MTVRVPGSDTGSIYSPAFATPAGKKVIGLNETGMHPYSMLNSMENLPWQIMIKQGPD